MVSSQEATDSPSPKPVAPEVRKKTPAKAESPPPSYPAGEPGPLEPPGEKETPPAEKEKQYRIYNTSGQTLYVINSEGTHTLRPREFYDLPFAKISHHIKLMVRRGFLRLFEKEEET